MTWNQQPSELFGGENGRTWRHQQMIKVANLSIILSMIQFNNWTIQWIIVPLAPKFKLIQNVNYPFFSTDIARPTNFLQQYICCSKFQHLQTLASLYLWLFSPLSNISCRCPNKSLGNLMQAIPSLCSLSASVPHHMCTSTRCF